MIAPERAAEARRVHVVTAALFLVTTVLLLVPVPEAVQQLDGGTDKLAHLGLFALLAAALWRSLRAEDSARPAVWAFAGTVVYGVLSELAQASIGLRSFELGDLAADVIGAGVSVGLLSFLGSGSDGFREPD